MSKFQDNVKELVALEYGVSIKEANVTQLYNAVSKAALQSVNKEWHMVDENQKEVCYLSAEFLVGRLIYNNLLSAGLYEEFTQLMKTNGLDLNLFEEIEDAALGNGGLGRLAACFLDSGATVGISLNGYGIRYKYGLFKQYFKDGFQMEVPDDWQRFTDPWSVRKEEEKVIVTYKNQKVYAVPYDTPVIGYGKNKVNTLRLWQAEPIDAFDFENFNEQKYDKAFKERDNAESISALLYPNDNTNKGKQLRLKQQFFFVSATLQDMMRRYKKRFGSDFSKFADTYAIQLNDTHPTIAVAELLRMLMEEEGLGYEEAFAIVQETCAYTNHTVMAEALEKWQVSLLKSVIPQVYKYILMINDHLQAEFLAKGVTKEEIAANYTIIEDTTIHMARLALYGTHATNGVAALHTEILKNDVFKEWYQVYPERFNNKTNGITQRRWLALCNMELSGFITDKVGAGWVTDLSQLKGLEAYQNNAEVLKQFDAIKKEKKEQLAAYIKKMEGIELNTESIFDVQIKRLHEYKRQLMNAFSILDIYYGIKEGRIKEFYPTTFLFGAKAAPGYFRAKGIIKFINEIGKMIEKDPEVNQLIKVVFVSNYNVSYAEKIVPAADVSEQISTAGTEASGTGNMKFMLNGAVTLGTYDGANVEIVEQAGMENNYIFGARVEEINQIKDTYNSKELYESNPRIKKVVDTLIDGTFDDQGTGMFKELYTSLIEGTSWHKPDHYFIFRDLIPYIDEKLKVNHDYKEAHEEFVKKCLLNTANAGIFSSDRTIQQYAKEIWNA